MLFSRRRMQPAQSRTSSQIIVTHDSSAPAPPRVAHVEVAGALGGSVVCLDVYLRHCDRHRFQHEVLFYRTPPELPLPMAEFWPVIDLEFPVPGAPAASGDAGRWRARDFLVRHSLLRRLVSAVRNLLHVAFSMPRALRLAILFRRRKYDLVHCNNNFNYQVATMLAARLARKPLLAHFRTPVKLGLLDRCLSRAPVLIVAINQAVAGHLRDQGVSGRIVVVHDPLENPRFSAVEAARLRPELLTGGDALIGTISRLDYNKGIEDLLAAARHVRERFPGARYAIVGRGARLESLRQLTGELGLSERVRFLGFQPNAFDYSASFDIFVNPSHNEGGPLTVLEAMLMGLPVVTTRVGMVPEWISDGEHGLIVEPGKPEALAGAIGRLLLDPQEARAMASRGAARARQLCNPERRAREFDDIVAAVLGTPASSSMNRTR